MCVIEKVLPPTPCSNFKKVEGTYVVLPTVLLNYLVEMEHWCQSAGGDRTVSASVCTCINTFCFTLIQHIYGDNKFTNFKHSNAYSIIGDAVTLLLSCTIFKRQALPRPCVSVLASWKSEQTFKTGPVDPSRVKIQQLDCPFLP